MKPVPSNFYAWPGTEHKSLQPNMAAGMRGMFADQSRQHINIPVPQRMSLADLRVGRENPALVADKAFAITTFQRKQCYGPAPYVGRPFYYRWDAWLDTAGRWCADNTVQIQYLMSEFQYEYLTTMRSLWGTDDPKPDLA